MMNLQNSAAYGPTVNGTSIDTYGRSGQGGFLLPSGYLSTQGSQIVDAQSNPVRIDAIGWSGSDSRIFAPEGLFQTNLQLTIDQIKSGGFNTIRIPWSDALLTSSPLSTTNFAAINYTLNPDLYGLASLQLFDRIVEDAANDDLKVIFDHHDNEGISNGQQANGLWFDSGPGTDGTDGSGDPGSVTAQKFLSDSVSLATRYAGNSTVIGFDLDNEPNSTGNVNWGHGGPTDIWAMYTGVGDAIQAVDPNALIIAEGPQEWSGPVPGLPAGAAAGDLSGVAALPVSLNVPNKIIYSVHQYPPDLSGNGTYDLGPHIAQMNAAWGYLVTQNIAPVWIGEMGANFTIPQDVTWIQAVLDYMNGKDAADGGPSFSGAQQPVSGSWWKWGSDPGQPLSGVLTAWSGGTFKPDQQVMTDQLLYGPEMSVVSIPTTLGSGPASLVLNVSEDAWMGDAQFTVSVDGTQLGGTQTVIASHAAGDTQAFILLGNFATGQHRVTVNFLNDAWGGSATTDRNLYVDDVVDGGTTTAGSTLLSNGAQTYLVGNPVAPPPSAPVTLGSGPASLVLNVSEDAWMGDAQFTVSVDGTQLGGTQTAIASHAAGDTQAFILLGNFATGQHRVTVNFLNDAWGGSATTDRNLYVDDVVDGGTTTAGSTLLSNGAQTYLVGNPVAPPPSAPVTLGSGPASLVLNVSEDAWMGDAQFTVSVDGTQLGGTQTAIASHAAGDTQAFILLGNFATGQHRVTVNFLNDAWGGSATTDRNLYVDDVVDGGTTTAGSTLLSNGAQTYLVGNPVAPPPSAPVTLGSGPASLVLNVSEDAWMGDAQFTVSVDGTQLGGTQTAIASHAAGDTQAFILLGNFATGQHRVTVNFLNDAWGGSATTDRNLYVDDVVDGGTTIAGSTLLSNGAQTYLVGSAVAAINATTLETSAYEAAVFIAPSASPV